MLVGHALADYPLQGDFLAKGKNRHTPAIPGETVWPWCLAAHALIHGGAVTLATGSVALGVAEAFAHAAIDFAKCEKVFGFHADQSLHVVCKLFWFAMVQP
jgi:hypothetical protein